MENLRRRKLTKEDLIRMRLPSRYWDSNKNEISNIRRTNENKTVKDKIIQYIKKIDVVKKNGIGIVLWGNNGNGKTCIAAVLAKEFRRRKNSVLFIECSKLKSFAINKEYFDEDQTYWDRAHTVDILVLDDLGKGTVDSTGFGSRLIDELIRTRNANKLITIITTNASATGDSRDESSLGYILMKSTMSSLCEHTIAIYVEGDDRRKKTAKINADYIDSDN